MNNKTTGNLKLIKKINRSLVLETIKKEEPITRAEISKKLNLSRSTVSSLTEELINKKLVFTQGYSNSTKGGGRRGVQLRFNTKSAFGVGVDIGGTKILFIVTDLDGNIVYKEKLKSTNKVCELVKIINDGLQKANIKISEVVGLGIGVPSITNVEEGIVIDAYALGWTNLNLKQELKEHFDFPIFINNDVNCGALGEQWLGSGNKTENMFFIALGTGVGSAIISDGRLIQGHNYYAGEIAYNVSEEDVNNNNYNKSGSFGVFEKKVSGKHLSRLGYSTEELFEEYMKKNEEVTPIINNFIKQLSINITNVVNLLNPELVIIGGGVSESEAMKDIIIDIQKMVDKLTPIKTNIKLAALGGDAGGLGAIDYAFNKIEMSDIT